MPSLIVTANTSAQAIAAEQKNASVVPVNMTIDNSGGAAQRTIRIQDVFTRSEYYGVETTGSVTVERWRGTVGMGLVDTLSEEDLKGIKCLGALKIIADAIDAGCYITVGYKHV